MKKIKISEYVINLREKENMSLRDFANKYNISATMAFRYEDGKMDVPTYRTATKFCKTFNITENVFVADFYYEDPKIEKIFLNKENIISRAIEHSNDSKVKNLIQKFYDNVSKDSNLYSFATVPMEKVEKNKFGIWHDAFCLTKIKNELVWIGFILYNVESIGSFEIMDYSHYASSIFAISSISKENLPDGCGNYIFLIPNKNFFNYLKEIPFAKDVKNNVIIYSVDRNEIGEKYVLFGKDFMKK